jgi:hypothetical protein
MLCCVSHCISTNNTDVNVDNKDCPVPMQRVIIADCGELPDTTTAKAATTNGKHGDNSSKAVSKKSKKHDSSDESDSSGSDSGSESSSTDTSAEVSTTTNTAYHRCTFAYIAKYCYHEA